MDERTARVLLDHAYANGRNAVAAPLALFTIIGAAILGSTGHLREMGVVVAVAVLTFAWSYSGLAGRREP